MALSVSYTTLPCFSSLSPSSSSSSPYSILPITTNPGLLEFLQNSLAYPCVLFCKLGNVEKRRSLSLVSRLLMNPIDQHAKSFNGACTYAPIMTKKRAGTLAKVSSEIHDGGESQSESDGDVDLPLEKLPLDSKLQQKLEHKMKLKLWKKIRLRNKKLMRKRRMRKRGCWPSSKMKKLTNI